jgi:predicted permease
VEIAQARAEIASIAAHVAEVNRTTNDGVGGTVLPVWKSHWGIQDSMRAPLGILMGAAGIVLLIVCANIANLLLAHASGRQKEFSVRVALGAPRSRLARQLLTETSLLSVAGSVLGLLAAFWLVGSIRYLIPTAAARNLLRPPIDSGVLWFTAALAIAVVMLAGIAPAIYSARGNVNDVLKEFGRDSTGSARSQRLRTLLVIAEIALAVVAIVGAGLFLKSFRLARMVQPGFDPQQVALGRFSMSTAGYDASQADAFCRRLQERLASQPGVVSVSYADYVPLSVAAGSWEDLQIEGYVPGASENMKIYRSVVSPGYFDTMKIPLLAGRDFTRSDDISRAPVMIVNQTFAEHFLRGEYPIGHKVNGWGQWFTIIGVAQDTKYYRLTEATTPYFYVPMRQIYRPEFAFNFFVRSAGSVDQAITALPREAQEIDPAVPAFGAMPLAEFISASLFQQQIAANLMSLLAGIAFVLAAIGLYGVMAFAVAQRTREIGIRVAMGAQRSSVLRLVATQAGVLLLAGVTAGLLSSAALGRFVSWMLFSVSPSDASVYAFAAAATILIAIVATLIPAVRAMRVDPLVALRYE